MTIKKGNLPACIACRVSSEERIDKNVLMFNIESACSKESIIMEHACQVQVNCVFFFIRETMYTPSCDSVSGVES